MANNSATGHSLTALLWNANGIKQHANELEILLNDKRIDIALISETHLTSRTRLNIQGYRIFRCDHPDDTGHGGAALIVRSSIKHNLLPFSIQENHMQAVAIVITIRGRQLYIASTYCPPRFRMNVGHFDELFNRLGNRFLLGGDYNSKHPQWGSRTTNPRGRVLMRCIMDRHLVTHSPHHPTYWPSARNRLPDLLDFFISLGLNGFQVTIDSLNDLSSDHSPILATINSSPSIISPLPSLNSRLIDPVLFQDCISNNIVLDLPLKTPDDIENAVEYLNRHIHHAACVSSSPRPLRQRHGPTYPVWIRELIQRKRRARHRWQQYRFPGDRVEFNRLSNHLKKELSKLKSEYYDNFLGSLSTKNGSLWTVTKRVLRQASVSFPLRKSNGDWAIEEEEKAELLADHLQRTFQPHADVEDTAFTEEVNLSLDSPLQLSPPPVPFTEEEVKHCIFGFHASKAPGYDLIDARILKMLPPIAIRLILYIYIMPYCERVIYQSSGNLLLRSHFVSQEKIPNILPLIDQ
jgi:hypothetical protein